MNGPRIPQDDVDRAYQRARVRDESRPGAPVRAAILAEARRSAAAAPQLPAQRWPWRAAAGIAAVGLVGLLSWHFVRQAPPNLVAAQAPPLAEPAPAWQDTGAPAPPANPARVAPEAAMRAAARPPVRQAAPVPQPATAAQVPFAAAGAPPRAADANAQRRERAADRAGIDRIQQSVRTLYPELYGAAPDARARAPLTVTIALNADGSVYASARTAGAAASASLDAVARIGEAFGIAPAELASAGVIAPMDGVTIIYGIRRPQRGDGGSPP